jgi:N-acetylglutamate synthase-like GNAT family acetyltransferase
MTDVPESIAVSPYVPGEREAVIDLVLGIQRGELGVPITLADQPDLADIPGAYQRGRGGFWVAAEGGRIVGVIGLLDAGDAVALRKMFVDRDHRGRGHVVAARLLETLLAHAHAREIARVFLGTRPEMYAAHRFYEKNGFVRLDASELPAAFPRMSVDSVFYRREVAT